MPAIDLPPDPTAPGRARAFVTATLAGTDLEALADTARLLTTELVTNAVVHTASRVAVAVEAPAGGPLTIAVTDADTGPLGEVPERSVEPLEGGRGLLLLARLADSWGTEHRAGHKRVWFRLEAEAPAAPGGGAEPRAPGGGAEPKAPGGGAGPAWSVAAGAQEAAGGAGPAGVPDRAVTPTGTAGRRRRGERPSLSTLVVPPALARALRFEEHLGELLARVTASVGARGAEVRAGPAGATLVAVGEVGPEPVWQEALVVDERNVGVLRVAAGAELSREEAAFLHLAAQRLALLCHEHDRSDGATRRDDELRFMAEATEMLAGSSSVSRTLALAAQLVVPRLAEWCASFVVEEDRRPTWVTANHRREELLAELTELVTEDLEVTAALGDAVASGAPRRLGATVSVGGRRTHVLVHPLVSRGRPVGVLVLGRSTPPDPASTSALAELGRRVALAADNARLYEERSLAAFALQHALLPSALPEVAGLDLAARYHSASPGLSVGGDFYDVFALPDGTVALVVGDVCGKGAEAAIVTGTSRDLLRLLLLDGSSPAAALRRLNRALAEHPSVSRFSTVAVVLLRRHPGGATGVVCLAGHPEPVVARADGTMELVGRAGTLVGLLDDADLSLVEVEVDLGPGDAVVLYTDGVTERRNGSHLFGQFGLMRALEGTRSLPADGIAGVVEDAVRAYVDDDLRDDFAVMVARLA